MPRAEGSPLPDRIAPISQKQEDLLIELFIQLSVTDRRKVIKLCRDLMRAAEKKRRAE